MPFFFIDYWYIVLVIPVLILSMIIQGVMKSTYRKYSAVMAHSGRTGAEMARHVMTENGIYNVNIVPIEGELSDHYDPRTRVIRLSRSVYEGRSVAALGVACHEAGHAVQHATGYFPLAARNAIAPVVSFCSGISWFVLILGIFMQYDIMINIGILLFASAAIFQFITLPVEFNASRRAVRILGETGILGEQELGYTRKVLGAAALTYVAGAASAILQLLRLILLFGGRRDD